MVSLMALIVDIIGWMRLGFIVWVIIVKVFNVVCRIFFLLFIKVGVIVLVKFGRLKFEFGNVSKVVMKILIVFLRILEFRCCKFVVSIDNTVLGERICISCISIFMFFCLIIILLFFNLFESVNRRGLSIGCIFIFSFVISNLIIWRFVILILKLILFRKLRSNLKSDFRLGWIGFVLVNCFIRVFNFLIFCVFIF